MMPPPRAVFDGERSDDEVCCAHDVSDAQRVLAEAREQQVSDALAEARLDEARSKHEADLISQIVPFEKPSSAWPRPS